MDSREKASCAPVEGRGVLEAGRRRQLHFDTRVFFIDVFIEMGFDDAVVVDPEPLTEGVLRDLEPAIVVPP
jgi:hypothetical protein